MYAQSGIFVPKYQSNIKSHEQNYSRYLLVPTFNACIDGIGFHDVEYDYGFTTIKIHSTGIAG